MCVPQGQVLFVLKKNEKFQKIKLGYPFNYKVLYIEPNVWYGFKCTSKNKAIICNITSEDNSSSKKLKKIRITSNLNGIKKVGYSRLYRVYRK